MRLSDNGNDEWFDTEEGKGKNPKSFWIILLIIILSILILLF